MSEVLAVFAFASLLFTLGLIGATLTVDFIDYWIGGPR